MTLDPTMMWWSGFFLGVTTGIYLMLGAILIWTICKKGHR